MIDELALRDLGLHVPGDPAPPAVSIGLGPRVRAWTWVHRRSVATVVPLAAVVAVIQSIGMSRSPLPSDDEGTYIAQAWAVQNLHRLAHYTYWYDHPPLGWIQIAAWTWVTDAFERVGHAVMAGRELMVVTAVVSAVLVFVVARRLGLRRPAAAIAAALFALSPLAVANHRMVLLDNVAVPWTLGAFALALSPRRSLWAAAGSGFCFAVAVLSKETFLLLALPLAYALWTNCDRRTRAFCVTAFGSVFLLGTAGFALYAVLKGELLPGPGHVSLLEAVTFQLFSRAPSGSVFGAGTPAHRTLADWLRLDPWLLAAGVALTPCALALRSLRAIGIALAVEVVTVLRGGYLPGPYVIGVLPFAALIVAGVGDRLWGAGARERRPRLAVAALTTALALGAVAPVWAHGDRSLLTGHPAASWVAAEAWVVGHVARDQRVLVDDSLWVDLVRHGWDREAGVVWFSKLGSANTSASGIADPAIARALPRGWREFAYVVSSPSLRGSVAGAPDGMGPVRTVLSHSTVVASFGTGRDTVQIRRVDPGDDRAGVP